MSVLTIELIICTFCLSLFFILLYAALYRLLQKILVQYGFLFDNPQPIQFFYLKMYVVKSYFNNLGIMMLYNKRGKKEEKQIKGGESKGNILNDYINI